MQGQSHWGIVLFYIAYAMVVLIGVTVWAWCNLRDGTIPTPAEGETRLIPTTRWVLFAVASHLFGVVLVATLIFFQIRTASDPINLALIAGLVILIARLHRLPLFRSLLREAACYLHGRPILALSRTEIVDLRNDRTIPLERYDRYSVYRSVLTLSSQGKSSSDTERLYLYGLAYRDHMALLAVLRGAGLRSRS